MVILLPNLVDDLHTRFNLQLEIILSRVLGKSSKTIGKSLQSKVSLNENNNGMAKFLFAVQKLYLASSRRWVSWSSHCTAHHPCTMPQVKLPSCAWWRWNTLWIRFHVILCHYFSFFITYWFLGSPKITAIGYRNIFSMWNKTFINHKHTTQCCTGNELEKNHRNKSPNCKCFHSWIDAVYLFELVCGHHFMSHFWMIRFFSDQTIENVVQHQYRNTVGVN